MIPQATTRNLPLKSLSDLLHLPTEFTHRVDGVLKARLMPRLHLSMNNQKIQYFIPSGRVYIHCQPNCFSSITSITVGEIQNVWNEIERQFEGFGHPMVWVCRRARIFCVPIQSDGHYDPDSSGHLFLLSKVQFRPNTTIYSSVCQILLRSLYDVRTCFIESRKVSIEIGELAFV